MKKDKKKITNQRRIIEQKIERFAKLNEPPPPSGWIKSIRVSLGMTLRQLAERVGVDHGSINQLEKREPQKKVTLESLERVAQAMDCKLVYAIVPHESGATLDDIIKHRAQETAIKILKDVQHTMRLEAQGTTQKQLKYEIHRIAQELISDLDSCIWDIEKPKSKRVK